MSVHQHEGLAVGGEWRDVVRRTIFALMGMARISQTKLGGRVGLTQSQLSQRLNGHVPFDEDELGRVAGVFGLDIPDLYSTEDAVRKSAKTLWIAPVIHGQLQMIDENDSPMYGEKPDLRSAC